MQIYKFIVYLFVIDDINFVITDYNVSIFLLFPIILTFKENYQSYSLDLRRMIFKRFSRHSLFAKKLLKK